METVPLKLNIDQIGKRQRCAFLFPVIVITICMFVITAYISPDITIYHDTYSSCSDPRYDPTVGGGCKYLQYDAHNLVKYEYRMLDMTSTDVYIKSSLRPVLMTNNLEEVGKF
jgi:hypothetical protein